MMIQIVLTMRRGTWSADGRRGDFTGRGRQADPHAEEHEVRKWLGLDQEVKGEGEKLAKAGRQNSSVRSAITRGRGGAFESFEGSIDSMDEATGKVKVIIEIFGRPTEVEREHWRRTRSSRFR